MDNDQCQNWQGKGCQNDPAIVALGASLQPPYGNNKAGHHNRAEHAKLTQDEFDCADHAVSRMAPIGVRLHVAERWESVRRIPDQIWRKDRQSEDRYRQATSRYHQISRSWDEDRRDRCSQ